MVLRFVDRLAVRCMDRWRCPGSLYSDTNSHEVYLWHHGGRWAENLDFKQEKSVQEHVNFIYLLKTVSSYRTLGSSAEDPAFFRRELIFDKLPTFYSFRVTLKIFDGFASTHV